MIMPKTPTGDPRFCLVMSLVISLLFIPSAYPGGEAITAESQAANDIRIVHVTNAGFLVMIGGKKVLIDALIDPISPEEPPPEVLERLETGQAPFDSLDLILATHKHHDHFRAESVLRALAHNPNAVFISTPQALSEFQAHSAALAPVQDRIRHVDLPADSSAEFEIHGLTVRIMSTDHGSSAWIQNYMYLVSSSSGSIFHEGDAEVVRFLDRHDFSVDSIDVAFVNPGLLMRPEFLRQIESVLRPRHLIPMHITAERREYADAMLAPLIRTRDNVHYLRDCLESITIAAK